LSRYRQAKFKHGARFRGQATPDAPNAQSEEPRGLEKGIADADKKARMGSTDEPVRDTPPAGHWNDTASD
jgi:hypothetical protein